MKTHGLRDYLSDIARAAGESGNGEGGNDTDFSINGLQKLILEGEYLQDSPIQIDVPTNEVVDARDALQILLQYPHITLLYNWTITREDGHYLELGQMFISLDKYYLYVHFISSQRIDYTTTRYYINIYYLESNEMIDATDYLEDLGYNFDRTELPAPFLKVCIICFESLTK